MKSVLFVLFVIVPIALALLGYVRASRRKAQRDAEGSYESSYIPRC